MGKRRHQRFWIVWCPESGPPSYRHTNRQSADREAKRLSELQPTRRFFVLKLVGGFQADAPTGTEIRAVGPAELADIPF